MWAYRLGHKEALRKFGADDFAPGLPSKKDLGDLDKLKPGQMVDFVVQEHHAERAGKHHDVRFGSPSTGLFSWATKKELPAPGKRISLFPQPVHRHDYLGFEGEIGEGYGKGKVRQKDLGKLLITRVAPGHISVTRANKRNIERYTLVRPEDKTKPWLLVNNTPTTPPAYEKEHFKLVKTLPELPEGGIVQPKVDGASSLIEVVAPNKIEVVSYRTAKGTGYPLVHTERLFHGKQEFDIPKKYVGTVLRGELYGEREGKAIPPQELGGILNSTIYKSIETQKDRGVKLKNMLFDIRQIGNDSTADMTYRERLDLLKQLLPHLPKGKFHLPEMAETKEDAAKMLKEIKAGKNPLTQEGVVVHAPEATESRKVKFDVEHDVYIRDVFPGEGKYKGHAGGFHFSYTPKGEIVGKVGTGLSDDFRKDLWKNKADYSGQKARVKAQEKLPSGALRAPVFLALHEG